MGKKKIITLSTTLCAIVLFVGIDVKTGCACIDEDGMVLRQTKNLVNETKINNGTYPTYDEVSKEMQFGTIHKYENARPKTGGVYYVSNQPGEEYILKRYADINFFGIKTPFVWEVESEHHTNDL